MLLKHGKKTSPNNRTYYTIHIGHLTTVQTYEIFSGFNLLRTFYSKIFYKNDLVSIRPMLLISFFRELNNHIVANGMEMSITIQFQFKQRFDWDS